MLLGLVDRLKATILGIGKIGKELVLESEGSGIRVIRRRKLGQEKSKSQFFYSVDI